MPAPATALEPPIHSPFVHIHTLFHVPLHAGGAAGWFRPSGLFAVLLTALPGLKAALVEPLRPDVAASEPEMALSCLALLEAGVR